MLLNDKQIRQHCFNKRWSFNGEPLVKPFSEGVQDGISYGLTSCGYDARLHNQVLIYKVGTTRLESVDPMRFKEDGYKEQMFDSYTVKDNGTIVLPGRTYALVQTYEEFFLPRWIKGRCVGKSTYARCGLIVNTTPLEPEWWGRLTIEVFACVPITLYVGQGIAQMEFERIQPCERSYADKQGKYQGQQNVTPPRIKDHPRYPIKEQREADNDKDTEESNFNRRGYG